MRIHPELRAQQAMLGVGVPIQRRTGAHLRHRERLDAHLQALRAGFADPAAVPGDRLVRLRERLAASPLCASLLRAQGLAPGDLRSVEDLRHFPLMHRDQLGQRWGEAAALGIDPDTEAELTVATSSGSSGRALPVLRDGYDQLHMWAAIRFWLERHRVALPDRPRLAFVCALPGGLEYSTRLPHFFGGALHRITTLRPDAAQRIARLQPSLLSSDPSGFHWLLNQDLALAPRLLLSSAQHLSLAQRALLASRFPAPLINYYASAEAGPIAWECSAQLGVFHALQPDVFVESVAGEVVVTRLRDSVVPLLRYRTGDDGQVVAGACPCGFQGRSIVGFAGRRACGFLRPDGAEVDAWNLIWLFKDLPLVGFRMEQMSVESFQVQVDGPLPMSQALLSERLALALVRLGWAAPQVEVRRVGALPQRAKPEPFLRSPDMRSSAAPGGAR